MIRLLGVICLVALLYSFLLASNPGARSLSNLRDIANWHGFYGILTLGVGLLIITGGIDLSIGSVVGLGAVGFLVMMQMGISPWGAVILVLIGGMLIGMLHGLLVTGLNLQPFLVTLCGLFIYRGFSRLLTNRDIGVNNIINGDERYPAHPEFTEDLNSLRFFLIGKEEYKSVFPAEFVVMLLISVVLWVLLHRTIYGRYFFAIGYNEQACRYAGIRTNRYKITSYVICSTLAALGGILYSLKIPSVSPSTAGQQYELYAITGAVLGGCALRGGDGTIIGIVLGTAVLPLLSNLIVFWEIPDAVEYSIIGFALLAGTIADQFFRNKGAGR
jgi:ribose transport system permease protein